MLFCSNCFKSCHSYSKRTSPARTPVVQQRPKTYRIVIRPKKTTCHTCPGCKVLCSSDDALLNHYIKLHVRSITNKSSHPVSKSVQEESVLRGVKPIVCEEATSCNKDKGKPDQFARAEGLFIADDVDISQRKLILLNDVEQHPGPVYSCKWSSCNVKCTTIGFLDAHTVSHTTRDKICRWDNCTELTRNNNLEIHALQHLYNDQTIFGALDDWLSVLGDQKLQETTNLVLCSKHLVTF
ncbi:uncharacterized protein LOC127860815 [Dreissena polymorpha]|uniref:uncharacterized protein LOC127860815 n=1 Tax=Dreissena polymorpha TaxID=45954 RepID=UPI0022651123|nr:uncharacterized protein LOC127860815 [Dreissena polymorpha]